MLVAAAPRNTSLSGSTQRQGPLHSHFLGLPTEPRASHDRPAKEKINIAAYKQESIRRKSVHRNVLRRDSDAGVKRQNIAKWPPRRHGGYLAKGRGFADADQKLRHSSPSGQGGNEVAAGL